MDFADEIVGTSATVTLVANSIGSISALQAAIDRPERVNGVAIVNPNFRELHEAEQPALLKPLIMPAIQSVQETLRNRGQPLFDALAKPGTVKQILKEPYFDVSAPSCLPTSVRWPPSVLLTCSTPHVSRGVAGCAGDG